MIVPIVPPHFSLKTLLSALFLGCIPHFMRVFRLHFYFLRGHESLKRTKQELHLYRFLGSHCWYSSSPTTRAGLENPICPLLCLWSKVPRETGQRGAGPMFSSRTPWTLKTAEGQEDTWKGINRVCLLMSCHGPVTFSGMNSHFNTSLQV